MSLSKEALAWAEAVFGDCELGDPRRTRRLVKMSAQLSAHAGEAPVSACRGDSAACEGAYRLLRNSKVAASAIAEGGFRATARSAASSTGALLALEDSTSLSYAHAVVDELGDLGGPASSNKRGFIVHSVLIVEAESGRTVGLIEQERWCREVAQRGQRHQRAERAYGDKESYKWQRASERMAARLGETQGRVISVCDREADVYEYLQYKIGRGERFVVRASWDRRVAGEAGHLFEALDRAPVLGSHTVKVPQRGGVAARRARQVELEVRAVRVDFRGPKRAPALGSMAVNAVLAIERDVPAGEERLCWLLLTSEPVGALTQAQQVLRYYARRWRVEDFHKAWKSGAGVEARRMQSADNLERTAVVLAFIAVRLLQLRDWLEPGGQEGLSSSTAGISSCAGVLDELEWKVLWVSQHRRRPPVTAPSLQWAYETLAKLGGWMNTKRTGRPGWAALWSGWFRLQERVDAIRVSQHLFDIHNT